MLLAVRAVPMQKERSLSPSVLISPYVCSSIERTYIGVALCCRSRRLPLEKSLLDPRFGESAPALSQVDGNLFDPRRR